MYLVKVSKNIEEKIISILLLTINQIPFYLCSFNNFITRQLILISLNGTLSGYKTIFTMSNNSQLPFKCSLSTPTS